MLSHNDPGRNNMYARTPFAQQGGIGSARAAMPPSGSRTAQRRRRRKLPLLLLAAVLIVSAVLLGANVYRGNSTLAVQVSGQQIVSIDLSQSIAVSPYLLGSNVFPRKGTSSQDQAGSGFMSYDQPVVQGLRSANIKLLRFPGGNWGEQHTLSTTQLDDFSNLLNQVGAEGIMQVQLSDPLDNPAVPLETRASRAALLVDYMNNKNSIQRDANAPFHPIKYWTIGNEPDLLINPDTNERYTVDEYTQAFIAYSLAMHQKDPSIKIFGPEISKAPGPNGPKDATGTSWMEGFLEKIGTYERTHALPFQLLDGVSFHSYPFDNAQQDANQLLTQPEQWNSVLSSLHQSIRQQLGEDLPVAITEINTNPGKNVPSQSLAATWWADTLGQLMSNQITYVAFFSTEGVDTPYPLFTQRGLSQTAMLRTMQLFSRLQNNFIPVQQAEQGPISMYATRDQGGATISLLFINKTSTSQQVNVQTDSLLSSWPWHSAKLNIGAQGMAVLTLHRQGSDEAYSFSNQEDSQQDVQPLACGGSSILTC